MGICDGGEARSIEEVAEFATKMRLGQTTLFPYPYGNKIDQIRDLIGTTTPLTTFTFKGKGESITIERYQTFPLMRSINFPRCNEEMLWQASKMLPREVSTFQLDGVPINMANIIQEELKKTWRAWGKIFRVSSRRQNGVFHLVIECFSN